MMSFKRIGIAIVEHRGRYLVGIRGPDGPLPGLAEFPGGKCLPDESPRDCAVRECFEETGLAVTADRLVLNCQHEYPHGRLDLHFWLCRPVNPGVVAEEHRGFRWMAADDLGELHFPEANAAVLALL